jgi:hypothetical protein
LGFFLCKEASPLKIALTGLEASIPLPQQAMGELLWLLLKSMRHGGLYIFIQSGSNASETLRPHIWTSYDEKDLGCMDDGPHVSAHGARQVPDSTGHAGMGMVVQHYILHEHARHSPYHM